MKEFLKEIGSILVVVATVADGVLGSIITLIPLWLLFDNFIIIAAAIFVISLIGIVPFTRTLITFILMSIILVTKPFAIWFLILYTIYAVLALTVAVLFLKGLKEK